VAGAESDPDEEVDDALGSGLSMIQPTRLIYSTNVRVSAVQQDKKRLYRLFYLFCLHQNKNKDISLIFLNLDQWVLWHWELVKIGLGTGIWAKFGLGNGIWISPPPRILG